MDKIKENGFKLTKERSRRYSAKAITDTDSADDIELLANAPAQAETLLYSLKRAAAGIGLHVSARKTEYMYFNQTGNISALNGSSLKPLDKFNYLESRVSTTWTLTRRMEKKGDGNCTRMLQAILNKSWRQHPTKQQLYGHKNYQN